MHYIVSGDWDEYNTYVLTSGLQPRMCRYITQPNQLPERLRHGNHIHLVGRWHRRGGAGLIHDKIGELLRGATQ